MISITPKLNFIFIFLLIITLIGGSYMTVGHIGGVEISAYRFVLVLTAGYLLLTKQLVFYTNRFSKLVFYFFITWFLYGAASLIWTPDLIYGIKELFYLGIGTLTFFVFLSFAHFEKDFTKILENSLVISFIVVIGFLVFEMITQQHLDGEYTQKLALLGDFHKSNIIPVFTFVNPNVGAIYLCICIVFSAWFLLQNRNKLLHIAIILIAFDFLLLMESRLGVLSVFALIPVTLFLLIFKSIRSKISLSFSKPQVVAFLLLIGLNSVVLYSELKFLKSESSGLGLSNTTCELCYEITEKIHQKTAEDGRILLMSNVESVEQSDDSSCMLFDKVFVIENGAYIKLLNNEPVELQFTDVNKDLYEKLFIGNNLFLLGSLILLFLVLVTAFILSGSFAKNQLMASVGITGVFMLLLLCCHSYGFPVEHYKQRVLVEKGFDVDHLKKTGLNVVSADLQTGKLLQTGKSVETYLYSKKMEHTAAPVTEEISSNSIRKNLALNGLDYLQKSHYMGIGAGGFLASNMKKLNKYPDGGVGGAHSFVIEILSQYGVVIFALLVGVFLTIFLMLTRSLNKRTWDKKHFLVLWLLIVLIFMGNANSSFLSLPMNWLLVTFLLIFANKLKLEKEGSNEIKD